MESREAGSIHTFKPSTRIEPFLKILSLLVWSAGLAAMTQSCVPRVRAIPELKSAHRLAADATLTIEVRHPDGKFSEEKVMVPKGFWVYIEGP